MNRKIKFKGLRTDSEEAIAAFYKALKLAQVKGLKGLFRED